MEAGNICSVSVFFVRVGSQISPRRAKTDSNIPSPGTTRSVKCPTPGPTKTIKSPPHALPFPRRLYIDRCITVENSPNASSVYIRLCKHRKKFFYCFYKITFPTKKRKTLCVTLIKREILTSRKILSTKSCTRNHFLFCKEMLCKIRIFLA